MSRLSTAEIAEIRERVARLIAGPHEWFTVDGKPVKAVMLINENTVEMATLLHEDHPRLLSHVSALEEENARLRELVEAFRVAGEAKAAIDALSKTLKGGA